MMNVLRRIVRISMMLALMAMTSGWVAAAPGDPYEINVILSLTGPGAFLGKDSQVALGLIEDSVNKDGGIKGRPIKFVIADDKSDAQVALQLANALIAKQVPLILGPGLAAQCNSILPVIATAGPVMSCYSPSIHPAPGSYGYTSGPSIPDYILGTVRFLRLHGWKKIALVTSIDASGQDGEKGVDAALAAPENKDMTLVDREHFNATDISVAAQMTHIKGSGAQAAIFWTTGTPFGTLLHGAFDAGLKIPIASSSANLNYTQLAGYASFLPDELYMMVPPFAAADALPKSGVQQSVERYLKLVEAAHIKPAQGHVTAWDSTMLAIDALKHAGANPTAAEIRSYLNGVKGWAGVNGVYDFKTNPQRGVNSDWLFMVRYNGANQSIAVVSKPGGIPAR